MDIRLETDRVTLGLVELAGIAIREEYELPPLPQLEFDTAPARRLYRAIGVDPTKTRPSSEALYRRLRRGQPLPRINALVDAVNYCSVVLALPFGAYDLDRIEGDVALRLGREGEGFRGIGKPWVNVAGRYVLADARGPFGNPTSDSDRTRVRPESRNALVTVFAPAGDPLPRLPWVASTLQALSTTGGKVSHRVLGGG